MPPQCRVTFLDSQIMQETATRTDESCYAVLVAPSPSMRTRRRSFSDARFCSTLALPQNRLQHNGLQGITREQFTVHNEMLGYC